MSKTVVGLDIGSHRVKVVVGLLDNAGNLIIKGIGKASSKESMSKGSILYVNKTSEAIRQAIEQADLQADLFIGNAITNITGTDITYTKKSGVLTRQSDGEEVQVEDVDRLTQDVRRTFSHTNHEVVHLLPQEYNIDSMVGIYDPVGISGMTVRGEFSFITIPQTECGKVRRSVEGSRKGMEVTKNNLVFSPLAAALSTLTEKEKEEGVALVDIGSGTIEIVIFKKQLVRHIAVLPFGGETINHDIHEGLQVSLDNAELLKLKYGTALSEKIPFNHVITIENERADQRILVKNLAIIIEERVKELAAVVEAEISRSGYGNRLPHGIVLTGGTAQLSGIEDIFKKVTSRHISVGRPIQNLSHNAPEEVKNPTFATVLGLVWMGFKNIDDREDLYDKSRDIVQEKPVKKEEKKDIPKKDKPKEEEAESGGNWLKKMRDAILGPEDDGKAGY